MVITAVENTFCVVTNSMATTAYPNINFIYNVKVFYRPVGLEYLLYTRHVWLSCYGYHRQTGFLGIRPGTRHTPKMQHTIEYRMSYRILGCARRRVCVCQICIVLCTWRARSNIIPSSAPPQHQMWQTHEHTHAPSSKSPHASFIIIPASYIHIIRQHCLYMHGPRVAHTPDTPNRLCNRRHIMYSL